MKEKIKNTDAQTAGRGRPRRGTHSEPFYDRRRKIPKRVAKQLGIQLRFFYWLEGAGVIKLAHNPDPAQLKRVKFYILPEEVEKARAWIESHGVPEHYKALEDDK